RKQQAVHKMKGLALAIDNGLEPVIRERINLVERGRSLLNGVAVDSEDDYNILNADLGGIVDVLDEFKVAISADVNIPVAILFGQSAKGMNATGQSDFESYYDLVESIQQHKIKPVLEKLIELLMFQKHIKPFENWKIKFPSLNTPTDKEIADVRKTNADAAKIELDRLINLVDSGALSTEELRVQIAGEFGIQADKLPQVDDDDVEKYQEEQKAKGVVVSSRN
ncbi:TPA: phage portal protein, partial [Haemophilus influenzae]